MSKHRHKKYTKNVKVQSNREIPFKVGYKEHIDR